MWMGTGLSSSPPSGSSFSAMSWDVKAWRKFPGRDILLEHGFGCLAGAILEEEGTGGAWKAPGNTFQGTESRQGWADRVTWDMGAGLSSEEEASGTWLV